MGSWTNTCPGFSDILWIHHYISGIPIRQLSHYSRYTNRWFHEDHCELLNFKSSLRWYTEYSTRSVEYFPLYFKLPTLVWRNRRFDRLQVISSELFYFTRLFNLDPCNDCYWTILCSSSTFAIVASISTFEKNISLVWAWSVASSTGLFVNVNLEKINESHYCGLITVFPHWTQFNVTSLILNVSLPLLILAVLYTVICIKLWSREVPGDGINRNQGKADPIKTAKKVTRMMLGIVFLFLICWLPFLISTALQLLGFVPISFNVLLFPVWLTVAYNGLNPYVYFTFNVKFRQAFKRLLGKMYIIVPYRSHSVELQQM